MSDTSWETTRFWELVAEAEVCQSGFKSRLGTRLKPVLGKTDSPSCGQMPKAVTKAPGLRL